MAQLYGVEAPRRLAFATPRWSEQHPIRPKRRNTRDRVLRRVSTLRRPISDLIYDVGLHRGEDTAFYLAKGFRVIGFEANAELIKACRARFTDEIAHGRLRIVEGAIDDSGATSVAFFKHEHHSEFGTTDESWASRNRALGASERVDVPAVDFTATLRDSGVPYFMKIDIEGADHLCLQALTAFDVKPTYVSLESEKADFQALVEEFDLLGDLGYNRFAVVQQGGIQGTEILTSCLDGAPLLYRFEAATSGSFGSDVGPWLSRDAAINRYKQIYRMYRVFGEEGPVRKTRLGRGLRGQMTKRLNVPLPGWYDTHATRVDV